PFSWSRASVCPMNRAGNAPQRVTNGSRTTRRLLEDYDREVARVFWPYEVVALGLMWNILPRFWATQLSVLWRYTTALCHPTNRGLDIERLQGLVTPASAGVPSRGTPASRLG